jgi:nitroimidazol reductase NimA-like FMN-containing flavoprotein (pyridoxamine 5'-phosphate oxidase superfamily)
MELIDLPRHQSESLLRAGSAGRIAVCTFDGPYVVPVNYSVVDESIVFRTTEDSFLATHAPNAIVALEVDQFDYENHRGWSVVARGQAHRIGNLRELEHVLAMWEPRTWADGPRTAFIKFPWKDLTGKRLGEGWSIEKNLLVNRIAPTGAVYS